MPIFTAPEAGTLLELLKAHFPDWKTQTLRERLKHGLVTVNGKAAVSGGLRVKAGVTIEIAAKPKPVMSRDFFPDGLGEPPLPLLYADADLLAVDKPSGLLSVATEREREETAVHLMREWLAGAPRGNRTERTEPAPTVHAAHRLDRDASGVLLFARSLEIKRRLAAEWRNFEKIYLAVTDGAPAEKEGTVDTPLWEDKGLFVRKARPGAGEAALTRYRVLKQVGGRSLIEVELGTGRKHQIRVHLSQLGCPIVGDLRYGVSKARRLCLHAHHLKLARPSDGKAITITAPVPALFKRELERGRGYSGKE